MNSGFRPLPKAMPFWERVNIMIKRGEAKDTSEAVRLLRPPKVVKSSINEREARFQAAQQRNPYKD